MSKILLSISSMNIINFIYWNAEPDFNLFGMSIRYYPFLFVIGLLISKFLINRLLIGEGFNREKLPVMLPYMFAGVILGARLGHCLFYEPDYFLANPLEIIFPFKHDENGELSFTGFSGLASHGGLIGFLTAMYIYARRNKENFIQIIDVMAVVGSFFTAFVRIGNLFNSEILGSPTAVPWAFIFVKIDDIPRHPTQLYEAISYVLVSVIMYIVYRKNRKDFQNGFLTGLVIVLHFICRIIIEFFKEKQVDFEDNMILNMGQLLSFPFIFGGFALMYYGYKKTKKDNMTETEKN